MHKPSVSVLMPVYNDERYLRESVDSILDQTYPKFEYLIIDDGSTDDTWEILTTYDDSRIRLIQNKRNIGLTPSLIKGLEMSRGRYIARMDADDISLPDRLEKQIDFLEQNQGVGFLGSAVQTIDRLGRPLEVWSFPESHMLIKWALCFYSPFVHPAMVMRRDILAVNGYDERLNYAQDYDLWRRFIWHTRAANLPDVLLRLRKHPHNITTAHLEEQVQNSVMISKKMIDQVLGGDVSPDIVHVFKSDGGQRPKKMQAAADVIVSLYQTFENFESLTPIESRQIKEDAIHRLINLSAIKFPHRGCLNILLKTFKVDGNLAWKNIRQRGLAKLLPWGNI